MTVKKPPRSGVRGRRVASEDVLVHSLQHSLAGTHLGLRREPSQERGRQTIDAVLRAAGREIAHGGLDRLTTKRIAVAAGLSVGAVYEYFPNKESIVAALIARWMGGVFEAVESGRPEARDGTDLFGYMSAVLERVVTLYDDQPGLGALFDTMMAMPVLRDIAAQHDDRIWQSLAATLTHYLPEADAAEVEAAARTIPLIAHEILTAAVVYGGGDRTRMIKNLRVCVMAIVSRLAMPV